MAIQKCEDLEVYALAFDAAMRIFQLIKEYPKEETYSLVNQIRMSSRSVAANIREGYAKRKYPDVFVKHLNDALGSSEETVTWIDFSCQCGYLPEKQAVVLKKTYASIGAMLYQLMKGWQKF